MTDMDAAFTLVEMLVYGCKTKKRCTHLLNDGDD